MKRKLWLSVLCSAVLLVMLTGSAAADEALFFTVDNQTWEVILPAEYLPYTTELGKNSPLLQVSGASQADMDRYMASLGCSVCCVNVYCGHQFWLSVKDQSSGLGRVRAGQSLPKEIVKSYLDGTAVSRGDYTTETYGGREYYIFANGQSINEGGISYRLSTFVGHYEVMLRWESGTGTRTADDIETLKTIFRSVMPVQ